MTDKNNCLACKTISIVCFFAIGTYLSKLGTTQKPRLVYNLLASVSFGLGVMQIFNYSPFRSKGCTE